MAMTKEHYYELGRQNALNGGEDNAPAPGTWRRDAWISGFDDARAAAHALNAGGGRTARQEHIRLLTKEINSSKIMTANRLLRIIYKLQVLKGREALCAST